MKMKAHKKREIVMASVITVSCVALLVLYHTLIAACAGESSDDADILYEEDTGDSYEI